MMSNASREKPSQKSKRGCVWGCILAPSAILAVALLAAGGFWVYESRRANQELAAEIQKVRAHGEPLTTVELDEFYVAAPDRPDMTVEILAALATCESQQLKAAAKDLPIVGAGIDKNVPSPPEAWEKLEAAEAFLAQHKVVFEAFNKVAKRDGTARYPVDLSLGISAKLEPVQAIRNATRVLSLKTAVDMHRGRPHDAVENTIAILALANTLDQMPLIIPQLVRIAAHRVAARDLEHVIRSVPPSDEDLGQIQQSWRNVELESAVRLAFLGERAQGYTCCLDPLLMNSKDSNPTPEQVQRIVARPPQRRRYDAAMILRLNTQIIEASNGLSESMIAGAQVEAEMQRLMKSTPSKYVYLMTFLVMPSCQTATQVFARGVAQRDSVDAAIAAERYRRKHGRWPETLEQLVPDFLPKVPVDPFTGQPLRMVSTVTELKVYSVGKDEKDDGGDFTDGKEHDTGFVISIQSEL